MENKNSHSKTASKNGKQSKGQSTNAPMQSANAGIISSVQKIEHDEIASYGTLRQFAETLGLPEAVTFLEATLNEENAADEILSEVAIYAVNIEAAAEAN